MWPMRRGWKKFEPVWDLIVRARRVPQMLPVLESVLSGFGTMGSKDAIPHTVPNALETKQSVSVRTTP